MSVYLEFQFGEPSPALSHAINLFIFLVNCVLVGVLTNIFLQGVSASRRIGALVVAILFYGLHPAQVEFRFGLRVVSDLMVTLFGLLTLIFGLQPGRLNALAMALCFFAATLCKEMAATLPAMLVLLQMARGDSSHGFSRIIAVMVTVRVANDFAASSGCVPFAPCQCNEQSLSSGSLGERWLDSVVASESRWSYFYLLLQDCRGAIF